MDIGIDVQVLVIDGTKWCDTNIVEEPNFYIGDGNTSYLVTPEFAVMKPRSETHDSGAELPDIPLTLEKIANLGGWRKVYSEQRKILATAATKS